MLVAINSSPALYRWYCRGWAFGNPPGVGMPSDYSILNYNAWAAGVRDLGLDGNPVRWNPAQTVDDTVITTIAPDEPQRFGVPVEDHTADVIPAGISVMAAKAAKGITRQDWRTAFKAEPEDVLAQTPDVLAVLAKNADATVDDLRYIAECLIKREPPHGALMLLSAAAKASA